MAHKMLFPGPTGTNSVESAIKMARNVTGRTPIVSFTNAFHGMTLGSLALTGNATKRDGAGISLNDAIRMPYDDYLGDDVDTRSEEHKSELQPLMRIAYSVFCLKPKKPKST